jgi:hypothetical protein
MPEKCYVHNCSKSVVAKGLCNTHYKRTWRNGSVEETRPDDWGKREKHSAYKSWCNLRRYHYQNMQESWKNDFWAFVKDVSDRPPEAQAYRPDPEKPWSADNFYWKEKRETSSNKKEYMRKWHKKARDANPEYYFDIYLRKRYKVTIDWYREQFSRQNGVCAICNKSETTIIHGKVILMPVDHDHQTGKARGLLCTKCNRGLGLFRDDKNLLKSAIEYLQKVIE